MKFRLYFEVNINIYDVISAASSKWNFQKYYPGLVGGHCIGVDPIISHTNHNY